MAVAAPAHGRFAGNPAQSLQVRAIGVDIFFPSRPTRRRCPPGHAGRACLVTLAQILITPSATPPLRQGALAGGLPADPASRRWAPGLLANHAGLSATARCLGNIGYQPDADGALRRPPVLTAIRAVTTRCLPPR